MYSAIAKNKRNTVVHHHRLFLVIIGRIGLLAALARRATTGRSPSSSSCIAAVYAPVQYFVGDPRDAGPVGRHPGPQVRRAAPTTASSRTSAITDGHADAEGVRHQRSGAQRVRHGTRPRARGRSPPTTGPARADDRLASSRACMGHELGHVKQLRHPGLAHRVRARHRGRPHRRTIILLRGSRSSGGRSRSSNAVRRSVPLAHRDRRGRARSLAPLARRSSCRRRCLGSASTSPTRRAR